MSQQSHLNLQNTTRPQSEHPTASFYYLCYDIKKMILDEAVQESDPIPGIKLIDPKPTTIYSVLQLCRHIRDQLLHDRRGLIVRWLQINTFSFIDPTFVALVTSRALDRDLVHVRNICINDWRAPCLANPYHWHYQHHPPFLALPHFPALERIVMNTGSIEHLPGDREREWMSTAEDVRERRYYRHMLRMMSRLPVVPLGLVLEVHAEMDAVDPDPWKTKRKGWPNWKVLVNLSSRRNIAGAGAQVGGGWATPSIREEIRLA